MVYTSSPDYLYRRNGIYYFTSNVPSDIKTGFNRNHIVVSLHTRRVARVQESAMALSDRLERYFESLRLERFYSPELGLKFSVPPDIDADLAEVLISEALALSERKARLVETSL